MEFSDRLSLDGDGLYRRLHFAGLPDVTLTWEIPVLLKYRGEARRVSLSGGVSRCNDA
jgi:hypothetical protein